LEVIYPWAMLENKLDCIQSGWLHFELGERPSSVSSVIWGSKLSYCCRRWFGLIGSRGSAS
jgi:hypothetical protein